MRQDSLTHGVGKIASLCKQAVRGIELEWGARCGGFRQRGLQRAVKSFNRVQI